MRPRVVVVGHVLAQHAPQVSLIDDDDVIETLSTQGPYQPFCYGVGLGRPHRREDGLEAEPCCLWDETL